MPPETEINSAVFYKWICYRNGDNILVWIREDILSNHIIYIKILRVQNLKQI